MSPGDERTAQIGDSGAQSESHFARLVGLLSGALAPPPGPTRVAIAVTSGVVCHGVFAAAVLAMIVGMFNGMSQTWGTVPWPWAILTNSFLVLQFPLGHSLLLSRSGRRWLCRLPLGGHAADLATTTYATIASVQLLALFVLWSPSGIVWWQAGGASYVAISACYAASWLLLIKASFDAGPEVQSGALGWLSVLQSKRPHYPDMPVTGLFRLIRQPIYLAFAMTLWTVPIWTPDQLALALAFTAYCLTAPLLKERRFMQFYGDRFEAYRARTPYMLPWWLWKRDRSL